MSDIIAGQVDMGVLSLPSAQSHMKSGAMRAICVSAAARIPATPEIPTAAEQGYPGDLVEGRIAVVGPKGLSAEQVKRINAAFVTACVRAPGFRAERCSQVPPKPCA